MVALPFLSRALQSHRVACARHGISRRCRHAGHLYALFARTTATDAELWSHPSFLSCLSSCKLFNFTSDISLTAESPSNASNRFHFAQINHVRRRKCTNCNTPKTLVKGASWRPAAQRPRRDALAATIRPVLPAVVQPRDSGSASTATAHAYLMGQAENAQRPSAPPEKSSNIHCLDQTQEWEAAVDDALAFPPKR